MKKFAILLLAGSMIGLAACGDNKNETTQEQIDSAANARSAAMEAEMTAKNDSLINAMAMMKADSAAKADSMARTSSTSTTTIKTTTTAKTSKPAATTHTTTTKTTETNTNPPNSKITKEQQKEQTNKFNER